MSYAVAATLPRWERVFNEQRVAEWPAPRTLCGLQDTGPLLLLVGGKAQPVIPLKEGGGAGGPSGDIWAYEYATKQWQLLSEDASAAAGRAGKVPGEEGEVRGFNEVDRPLTGSEAQTDKLPGLEGLSFAWMHHPNYGVVWGGYERGNEYSDGLYKLDITPACVQDKKCKYPQTDTEQCGARHGVGGCMNGKCECNPAFLQASFAGTEGLPKAVAVTRMKSRSILRQLSLTESTIVKERKAIQRETSDTKKKAEAALKDKDWILSRLKQYEARVFYLL